VNSARHNGSTRRFNLGDGLILIGAAAIALGSLRANAWLERLSQRYSFWREAYSELTGHIPQRLLVRYPRDYLMRLVVSQIVDESAQQLLGPVVWGLTLVQPLMRLRSPRPPLSRLIRQAGFVTCVAAPVGYLVTLDFQIVGNLIFPPSWFVGLALLLLWPVLGLPPWHTEASWIDRLGRAVGWGWIVVEAGGAAATYVLQL